METKPEHFQEQFQNLKAEIGKVVVGQQKILDQVLLDFSVVGMCYWKEFPVWPRHCWYRPYLLCLSAELSRIQFTPDMLPGDVTGTQIFNPKEGTFCPSRSNLLKYCSR